MRFRNQHEQQILFKDSNEEDQQYKEQCFWNLSYTKVSLSPNKSAAYGGNVLLPHQNAKLEVFFSKEFTGVT